AENEPGEVVASGGEIQSGPRALAVMRNRMLRELDVLEAGDSAAGHGHHPNRATGGSVAEAVGGCPGAPGSGHLLCGVVTKSGDRAGDGERRARRRCEV